MRSFLAVSAFSLIAFLTPGVHVRADDVAVVSTWEYRDNAGKNGAFRVSTLKLYSNGRINAPDSSNTWKRTGDTLVLRWPDPKAPGGAWKVTCKIAADGKSFSGRNQVGTLSTGKLLSQIDTPETPLPNPPSVPAPADRGMSSNDDALPAKSRELRDAEKGPVTCLAFSPDGTRLVSGTKLAPGKRKVHLDAVRLMLWNLDKQSAIWTAERQSPAGLGFNPDPVGDIEQIWASTDGTTLVSWDGGFHVWDGATGNLRGRGGPKARDSLEESWAPTTAWAVSPDCTLLAIATADPSADSGHYRVGDIMVWDLRTSKVIATLPGADMKASDVGQAEKSPDWVSAMAFSPDGTQLAAQCGVRGPAYGHLKLWNLKAARLEATMPPPDKVLAARGPALQWLGDGTTLTLRLGSTLEVWDTSKAAHTETVSLSGLQTADQLAGASYRSTLTSRPQRANQQDRAVNEFENQESALSADGTRLAVQVVRINRSAKPPLFESHVVVWDISARHPWESVPVRLSADKTKEFEHRMELRRNEPGFDPRGISFPVPLALSADGKQLAIAEPRDLLTENDLEGVVRVYDVSRTPQQSGTSPRK